MHKVAKAASSSVPGEQSVHIYMYVCIYIYICRV